MIHPVTRLLAAAALLMGQPASAADDESFTPTRSHAGHQLALLGSGTARAFGLVKVYDAALYGPESSDPLAKDPNG